MAEITRHCDAHHMEPGQRESMPAKTLLVGLKAASPRQDQKELWRRTLRCAPSKRGSDASSRSGRAVLEAGVRRGGADLEVSVRTGRADLQVRVQAVISFLESAFSRRHTCFGPHPIPRSSGISSGVPHTRQITAEQSPQVRGSSTSRAQVGQYRTECVSPFVGVSGI
jgi:hypothetical protein